MNQNRFSKSEQYQDIIQLLDGSPAMPMASLPLFWQNLAHSANGTGLDKNQRQDYIKAAQIFRYHGTPLGMEALAAIGKDFLLSAYPDLDQLQSQATEPLEAAAIKAVKDLFDTFGYAVPAALYNVILATVSENLSRISIRMFKEKNALSQDRLWDAVLHASLLVTPVGLFIQSVLSRHGLRFTHCMNCRCSMDFSDEAPFTVALDSELLPAYLQNMVAASFEQYGVNAATSRAGRGF